MRTLIHIARYEIRMALRDRLALALGLLIWGLFGLALYTGHLSYQQQQSIIEATQHEKRQEWLGQGDKHPHIAAHYGTFAFKPKTALSLFDYGLDAFTGTSVYLEAHYQHEFMFRPAQDHSTMIRFGELSAALVLNILLPLLIIFLAFSSFTKERERGTLRLMLSQGTTLWTLAWGKILAYGLLVLVLLIPFIVGVGLLVSAGAKPPTLPDVGLRLLGLLLLYGAYLLFFIFISVAISMRSATSRNALLLLLSTWIFFTVLMPKSITNLSEGLHPLPSMREFKANMEADMLVGLDGKSTREVRMAALEQQYLQEYEVEEVTQLPFNYEAVQMQAGEDFGNAVYDHHVEELRQLLARQNRLGSMASLLNPFLAAQHLAMALCGTDLPSFFHFEDEVETYRRDLVRRMNQDMRDNSAYGEFYGYKAGVNLWKDVQDFHYQGPAFHTILPHYWLEILSLVLWVGFGCLLLRWFSSKKFSTHG
ncbi:MAG: DUF3526 domain-containing protein [Bacteroidota bacterium]